jgi:enamine deaminase RidA (YjgF/YER057c/UK114 family)
MIERLLGRSRGRSPATAYGQLAWIVANASDETAPLAEQIDGALTALDERLQQVGSSRQMLLSVQVFLAAISDKPTFDAAWERWIGADPEHWPQRACVGVALTGGLLVELVAVVARAENR